jgi:uncharacterized protein
MARAVFDTNVFISAFITPGGRGEEAVRSVIHGEVSLFTSLPLLTELARKLYEKFGWERNMAMDAAGYVSSLASVVSPKHHLAILKDEPDNRVLECAIEAGADCIVTGDRHLLELGTFETVRVITLSSFLKTFH